MKESKFIELLNLYVDHEITPAEAAELETEIQRNPERRQVYLQYCRIQKGCTVLAEHFRTEAPEPAVPVTKTSARSRAVSGWIYAGGLAAAACAAFVVTLRLRQPAPAVPDNEQPAQELVAATAPAPVTLQRPVNEPRTRMDFQPVLVSHTLHLNSLVPAEPELTSLASSEQPRLDWLQNVRLSPLRPLTTDELRFDTRASAMPAESRVYAGRKPVGTVEMTAFQFQR